MGFDHHVHGHAVSVFGVGKDHYFDCGATARRRRADIGYLISL